VAREFKMCLGDDLGVIFIVEPEGFFRRTVIRATYWTAVCRSVSEVAPGKSADKVSSCIHLASAATFAEQTGRRYRAS